jgi:hypothetical protein
MPCSGRNFEAEFHKVWAITGHRDHFTATETNRLASVAYAGAEDGWVYRSRTTRPIGRHVLARLIDENDAPALAGEGEYVVLGLLANNRPDDPLSFMLFLPGPRITDWAWYDRALFEITDPSLPPSWVYHDHGGGCFALMPGAWTRRFFWDDMFSDDRGGRDRAWPDYRAERDLILSHAGRPPGRGGGIRMVPAHVLRPNR